MYRTKRRTLAERQQMERESLDRARSNPSWANFGQVIAEFAARGIPEQDISPKDNVLTYNAWRALGRQVRRGEKSVKILTYAPITSKERDPSNGEEKQVEHMRPVTACVFHVSQTDPVAELATA